MNDRAALFMIEVARRTIFSNYFIAPIIFRRHLCWRCSSCLHLGNAYPPMMVEVAPIQ